MMEDFLLWSLKAGALLTFIFTLYYFLFRNNTAFRLRRALVLATLLICSVAPFISFEVAPTQPLLLQKMVIQSPNVFELSAPVLPAASATPIQSSATIGNSHSPVNYAAFIYVGGVGLSLLFFLIELLKIFYWKVTGQRQAASKHIIRHHKVKAPFTFGKDIFLPEKSQYDTEIWRIIHLHEQSHIIQKHTLDLIITRLFQCLFWYNPVIYLMHKELKLIHEALADQEVLKTFSINQYANTLLQVNLSHHISSIGHSFAVISTLSKRLKLMKKHKTSFRSTLLSLLSICLLTSGTIGWSALKGQEIMDQEMGEIDLWIPTFTHASVRSRSITTPSSKKITQDHQRILNVLKTENPDLEIGYRYFAQANFKGFFDAYNLGIQPLYLGQLTNEQKQELKEYYKNDTVQVASYLISQGKLRPDSLDLAHIQSQTPVVQMDEIVEQGMNYIMIYYAYENGFNHLKETIYEANEVDEMPQVVGGLENLAKTIALDIKIPENLDKRQLPETIDFHFVVEGGNNISHLNLATEIKGAYEQNKPYYKFYGQIHNQLRERVLHIYPWRRGKKDGKEVLVRMKIAIPTKYML